MKTESNNNQPVAHLPQKHAFMTLMLRGICITVSKHVRLLRILGDYEMSLSPLKQKLAAAFVGAASIMLPMNAANADATPVTATKTEQSVTPSTFKKDANGVLWFQEGTDGQKALGAAGRLSGEKDTIVIFTSTSDKLEAKACNLARQMHDWLEKHPKVNADVLIVGEKIDKGAGYSFLMNGVWLRQHELASHGVFSPAKAPKALNDIVTTYMAAIYNEEKRKAGDPVVSRLEP